MESSSSVIAPFPAIVIHALNYTELKLKGFRTSSNNSQANRNRQREWERGRGRQRQSVIYVSMGIRCELAIKEKLIYVSNVHRFYGRAIEIQYRIEYAVRRANP